MFHRYLQEACRIAYNERYRDTRGFSLAAVGIRDDCIVRATNILSLGQDTYTHAECRCLRKMHIGGTVYVARVRKDGSIGNSRPCGGCRLAAKFKRATVIYSISENEFGVCDYRV